MTAGVETATRSRASPGPGRRPPRRPWCRRRRAWPRAAGRRRGRGRRGASQQQQDERHQARAQDDGDRGPPEIAAVVAERLERDGESDLEEPDEPEQHPDHRPDWLDQRGDIDAEQPQGNRYCSDDHRRVEQPAAQQVACPVAWRQSESGPVVRPRPRMTPGSGPGTGTRRRPRPARGRGRRRRGWRTDTRGSPCCPSRWRTP